MHPVLSSYGCQYQRDDNISQAHYYIESRDKSLSGPSGLRDYQITPRTSIFINLLPVVTPNTNQVLHPPLIYKLNGCFMYDR